MSSNRRLLTSDDIIETVTKGLQRGLPFLLSKFSPRGVDRTISAFGLGAESGSNWWSIPAIQQRWNEKITGDPDVRYEEQLVTTHLASRSELRLLSIGCGICSHERRLAASGTFAEVVCVDLVEEVLNKAEQLAADEGLSNMRFIAGNAFEVPLEGTFDVILFHSSLHHFFSVAEALDRLVEPYLAPDGLLVVHEFVGADRLQHSHEQIIATNNALQEIAVGCRERYALSLTKRGYSGPGLLRMYVADPSECADSESILPELYRRFSPKQEVALGGNLLTGVFKDIAHHFFEPSESAEATMRYLFRLEDEFLEEHPTDCYYGVFTRK